ncbi:MAG TPA: translation initiation factor IF-2 associated domain-containing protein, partial [Ensifer sp.]|nr:translation initiation factor IF-2 associated domain-containing protein [Ensifer sp.]
MTDNNDDKTGMAGKKTLTLKPSGFSQGTVRQDMGRGRTKAVVVETRKRRINRPEDEKVITPVQQTQPAPAPRQPESQTRTQQPV